MKMTHIEDAVNNPDEYVTHTEEAENNQDENVTHTEEVENNQDKEQQAGEINFFETRTITFVVKKHKRKFIRHTLPEISKTNLTWMFYGHLLRNLNLLHLCQQRILRRKHSQKLPSRKHSTLISRKQQINIKERK
jgi:hypothetical protein